MLSLKKDILPRAPGVCADFAIRRAPHLLDRAEAADRVDSTDHTGQPGGAGRTEQTARTSQDEEAAGSDRAAQAGLPAGWARHPRLSRLAEEVRQLQSRFHPPTAPVSTGLAPLDAVLGGGFSVAALHELIVPCPGTGAETIVWRTSATATATRKWIVYIDLAGDLYPPGLAQAGVPLGRLLILRPDRRSDALWACEQALRCSACAVVILPLRTLSPVAGRRLQLAAESGGTLGFLIRDQEERTASFAATRLRLTPLPADAGVRRLSVTVLKGTHASPGVVLTLELPDAADAVPAPAELRDRAGAPRQSRAG